MSGTYTINSTGITMSTGTNTVPNPPKEMVAVTAVKTSKGWLGQNLVDGEIVWESKPLGTKEAALNAANLRIINKLKDLFS